MQIYFDSLKAEVEKLGYDDHFAHKLFFQGDMWAFEFYGMDNFQKSLPYTKRYGVDIQQVDIVESSKYDTFGDTGHERLVQKLRALPDRQARERRIAMQTATQHKEMFDQMNSAFAKAFRGELEELIERQSRNILEAQNG